MKKLILIVFCTVLFPVLTFAQKNTARHKNPHLTIGTIGSVDTGKTTLVCAIQTVLCKVGLRDEIIPFDDLDDLPEERERGITIVPSVINYSTGKVDYTHYDFPGHEDYLFEMKNSKVKLDGAILVVAGTDDNWDKDWKVKMKNVLKMAREAKIDMLVVFINKCDMIDDIQILDNKEKEIRVLLSQYGYSRDTPVVRGSALGAYNGVEKWMDGIRILLNTCDAWFTKE